MKNKSFRTIAALTIAISLVGGTALAMPAMAVETTTRYISVSATGTTMVVPDAVRINATVSVLTRSSKEALAAVATWCDNHDRDVILGDMPKNLFLYNSLQHYHLLDVVDMLRKVFYLSFKDEKQPF